METTSILINYHVSIYDMQILKKMLITCNRFIDKYNYFSYLQNHVIEKYPKQQRAYLQEAIMGMRKYSLDSIDETINDKIVENICQKHNSVDRKVLESFSNDAKSLLRDLN